MFSSSSFGLFLVVPQKRLLQVSSHCQQYAKQTEKIIYIILNIYTYIYNCICVCVCVYIYVYISISIYINVYIIDKERKEIFFFNYCNQDVAEE